MDYQQTLNSIRENAKLGDIIFLGGNDLISNLIKHAQRKQTQDGQPSLWSHVCLYVNRNLIVESTLGFEKYRTGSRFDNGVQFYMLEERIKEAKTVALVQYPLTDIQREKIFEVATELFAQNIKYPVLGLFGSLLTYWLFPKWKNNPLDNENRKLYCSAFVAVCYRSMINFNDKYSPDNISPQLIWNASINTKDCKTKFFN